MPGHQSTRDIRYHACWVARVLFLTFGQPDGKGQYSDGLQFDSHSEAIAESSWILLRNPDQQHCYKGLCNVQSSIAATC
jgi:hypothetical protein